VDVDDAVKLGSRRTTVLNMRCVHLVMKGYLYKGVNIRTYKVFLQKIEHPNKQSRYTQVYVCAAKRAMLGTTQANEWASCGADPSAQGSCYII